MKKSESVIQGSANRRMFLKNGVMAAGATTVGAGLLAFVLVALLIVGLEASTAVPARAQASGTWANTGTLNAPRNGHSELVVGPVRVRQVPGANTVPGILSSNLAVACAPARSSQLAMSLAPTRTAAEPLDAIAFFMTGVCFALEGLWPWALIVSSNIYKITLKNFIGPHNSMSAISPELDSAAKSV